MIHKYRQSFVFLCRSMCVSSSASSAPRSFGRATSESGQWQVKVGSGKRKWAAATARPVLRGDQQGARGRTMLSRTDAFPSNFLQVAARQGGRFFYGDIDGRKVVGLNQHALRSRLLCVCDSFDVGRDRTGPRLSKSARFEHNTPLSRVKNRLLDAIDMPLSRLVSERASVPISQLSRSLAHARS